MPPHSATPWCSAPLAILTSGQQDRFTYETAFAFVRAKSGRTSLQTLLADRTNHCAPPRVDSFIVLSLGRSSTWTLDGAFAEYTSSRREGTPATSSSTIPVEHPGSRQLSQPLPPSAFDPARVEAFYRRQGVARTKLILLSDAQMANATHRIELEVARRGARAVASSARVWWRTAQSTIPRWHVRWSPHSRMFYLRHVAFQAAISAGQSYGQYVSHKSTGGSPRATAHL